jgi:hypothetical protein
MSKAQLLAIVIRFIAIYLVLEALTFIPMFVGMGEMRFLIDGSLNYVALIMLAVLLLLVILFLKPLPIAKLIMPGDANEKLDWNLNINDIQAVAFSVLGLYLVANSLTDLAYWIYFLTQLLQEHPGSELTIEQKANIVELIIEFVVGLYLLFGSSGLQGLLIRFRRLGTDK